MLTGHMWEVGGKMAHRRSGHAIAFEMQPGFLKRCEMSNEKWLPKMVSGQSEQHESQRKLSTCQKWEQARIQSALCMLRFWPGVWNNGQTAFWGVCVCVRVCAYFLLLVFPLNNVLASLLTTSLVLHFWSYRTKTIAIAFVDDYNVKLVSNHSTWNNLFNIYSNLTTVLFSFDRWGQLSPQR